MKTKQEHKVSYRCSLPSPLQKGSKDWEVLIRLIHKWDHAIYQKLPKIWNHDLSLPALQHIMTHKKSFVTFYMDTHFQNHCMIFTMHDSLQVASDSVSSPHRFFNSSILCAAFCFSSFLIWALIAFNSRESFFLPNPWIISAMVMAMSIYRTLCVLVSLTISLQEMLIAFDNEIRFQSSDFRKHEIIFQKSFFRNQTSDINARDVPS